MGLQVVNEILADNYIRPDESTMAQSKVKEAGKYTFIDKVKVRLVDSQYWSEVTNFGHKYVHIPDRYVREFDRLLTGGIWAQVDMHFEYDEETKGKYPFWIDKLTPIQLATFDLEAFRKARVEFTVDEWLDLILRSMGYEPSAMERRIKFLFLTRLIPLCERNFNLVELGPPRHREERRGSRALPILSPTHGSYHGGEPLWPTAGPLQGHGPDLGRHRIRRGSRSSEDAERSHHNDEDVLRVRAVPARTRGDGGLCQHSPCSGIPSSPLT